MHQTQHRDFQAANIITYPTALDLAQCPQLPPQDQQDVFQLVYTETVEGDDYTSEEEMGKFISCCLLRIIRGSSKTLLTTGKMYTQGSNANQHQKLNTANSNLGVQYDRY